MKSKVIIWKAVISGKENDVSKQDFLNKELESLQGKKIINITQSESGTAMANYKITWTVFYEE